MYHHATWYSEVHLETRHSSANGSRLSFAISSTEIILRPGLSWSSRYPTTVVTASVHSLRASCQAFAPNLVRARQDTDLLAIAAPLPMTLTWHLLSFHSVVGFSYMEYIGILSLEAEANDELQRLTKHILSLVSVQKKTWSLGVPSGEPGHPPKSGRWWWPWGLPSRTHFQRAPKRSIWL